MEEARVSLKFIIYKNLEEKESLLNLKSSK